MAHAQIALPFILIFVTDENATHKHPGFCCHDMNLCGNTGIRLGFFCQVMKRIMN
jgi:hypothetical protein